MKVVGAPSSGPAVAAWAEGVELLGEEPSAVLQREAALLATVVAVALVVVVSALAQLKQAAVSGSKQLHLPLWRAAVAH